MSKNIEMQHKLEDGSYDLLLPKTESKLITVDNTELNSHLGDTNTLEGNLEYLSRLYAHWWKREIKIPVYSPSYGDFIHWQDLGAVGLFALYNKKDTPIDNTFILYASNNLDESKSIPVLVNPVTITVRIDWQENYKSPTLYVNGVSNRDSVENIKYSYWGQKSIDPADTNLTIYTSGENQKGAKGYLFCSHYDNSGNYARYGVSLHNPSDNRDGLTPVSMSLSSYNTTIDYVYSFDRNANPDSGTTGNYTWAYKGIPFWNAVKDYISTD